MVTTQRNYLVSGYSRPILLIACGVIIILILIAIPFIFLFPKNQNPTPSSAPILVQNPPAAPSPALSASQLLNNPMVFLVTAEAVGKITNVNGSQVTISQGKSTMTFTFSKNTSFYNQVSKSYQKSYLTVQDLTYGRYIQVSMVLSHISPNGIPQSTAIMFLPTSQNVTKTTK